MTNEAMSKKLLSPEDRPSMTVFAGTNGAGKSELTNILKHRNPDVVVIDADEIARGYRHLPQNKADFAAGREAVKRVRDCIQSGKSFSIETTLGGQNAIRQMELAKQAGFKINLYYVGLDNVNLHIERVAQRVAKGGHHIPEEDIRRRYVTSLENLPKAMRLADHSYLFDNSKVYQIQAEVYRGLTKYQAPANEMTAWAKSAMNEWNKGLKEVHKELQNEQQNLSQQLKEVRKELYELESPIRAQHELSKLEARKADLDKRYEALKPKTMIDKIRQPNKHELEKVVQRQNSVNRDIKIIQNRIPGPAEMNVIKASIASTVSLAELLDKALKECTKQVMAVGNELSKRELHQTMSQVQQKDVYQSPSMER
ncbi:zeta toxin family protein [Priestia sp. BR_2]